MRRLVVSGINLAEGGPLTVLQEFLSACDDLPADWEIVAFVHSRALVKSPRIKAVEIPEARGSWLRRLRIEWFRFRKEAARLQPDLWVSLHDITPWVGSVKQVVYCHNAVPFCRLRVRDAWFEPARLLFRLGYPFVYRLNIRRNSAIIVQQTWMRQEFKRWVGARVPIIVAYPASTTKRTSVRPLPQKAAVTFLYPTLPRPFKNLELIGRAVEALEHGGAWNSKVIFTINGNENSYARWIRRRFGSLSSLHFIGRQTREQMLGLYGQADCLLFPSRMESWGLPITEARQHGLPIFAAKMPYAYETVGTYQNVDFIDLEDDAALASKLLAFQQGRFTFEGATYSSPASPFAATWSELVSKIVEYASEPTTDAFEGQRDC